MNKRLKIIALIILAFIAGAFVLDAVLSKPQREILIDTADRPAPSGQNGAQSPAHKTLTPMP